MWTLFARKNHFMWAASTPHVPLDFERPADFASYGISIRFVFAMIRPWNFPISNFRMCCTRRNAGDCLTRFRCTDPGCQMAHHRKPQISFILTWYYSFIRLGSVDDWSTIRRRLKIKRRQIAQSLKINWNWLNAKCVPSSFRVYVQSFSPFLIQSMLAASAQF